MREAFRHGDRDQTIVFAAGALDAAAELRPGYGAGHGDTTPETNTTDSHENTLAVRGAT